MILSEPLTKKERRNSISTIEKFFIRTGNIIAIRCWDGGEQYELDIHLPNVNFAEWNTVQKIKCRTSPLHFTDYTPAMWSIEEKICTLYIDTSHMGRGSQWAKKQQPGNLIYYFNPESAKHYPVSKKHLIFLGDQTSVGHFCALHQLAPNDITISGFINVSNAQTAMAFTENCPWLPLQSVIGDDEIYYLTERWIQNQSGKEHYLFYVAGNGKMVIRLRKMLKQQGINGNQIKSEGFWQ